jgi:hypothetical protein
LPSITLPNSITNIGGYAFRKCYALTSVTNLNPVPVEIVPNVFDYVNQSACILEVSSSAVSVYQNAEVWKNFNIKGSGFLVNTAVNNVKYGYTTGDGIYKANAIATVSATAYSGYKFVNWTKEGVVVSTNNPYHFNVKEEVNLVAHFETSVGIAESQLSESVQVYPNPTTGELTITNYELRITSVEIYDIYGKKQKCTKARMHESANVVDISEFRAGIYFVRIGTEKGIVTKKVVKM